MSNQDKITRKNPIMFLFLLDQSRSMEEPFGIEGKKHEKLTVIINKLLYDLTILCTKGGEVRDYCYIGIIGYGAQVDYILGGNLKAKSIVSISEIATNPSKITNVNVNEKNVRFPVWIEPVASGSTPMCETLKLAFNLVKEWLDKNPESLPPIVINSTDGESTDGDPSTPAKELQGLKNNKGNVLLFNVHISSVNEDPSVFPDSEGSLSDKYAKQMFNMSSLLPEYIRREADTLGYNLTSTSRGFIFNADSSLLTRFLNFGTVLTLNSPNNLR